MNRRVGWSIAGAAAAVVLLVLLGRAVPWGGAWVFWAGLMAAVGASAGSFGMQRHWMRELSEVSEALERLADGGLERGRRLEPGRGAAGRLRAAVNRLLDQVEGMVRETRNAAEEITSSAEELSRTSEQIVEGMENQTQRAEQVATAVEEMAATVVEVANNASSVSQVAEESAALAQKGKKVTQENMQGMDRIAKAMHKASETASTLSTRTQEIGDLARTIEDIADQTNLLALNAAIEAARAGEHGRGFAVVADEVRKLSERTSKATREISGMLKTIQEESGEAVVSIVEGLEEVEKGTQQTREAGEDLQVIVGKANEVLDRVRQIAAAMEEASRAVEEISQSMSQISVVTRQATEGSSESLTATRHLAVLAENLKRKVDSFRMS